MATTQTVMQKIQNLIQVAQSTTGLHHPDLHSAVKALVKGYRTESPVTVYKGEYTVSGSGSDAMILKIVHNFGKIEPFSFFMYPKGTKFPSASGDSVCKVQLYVPTVFRDPPCISYGPGNEICFIDNKPMLSGTCMNGSTFDCAYNPLWIIAEDPNGAQKFSVTMWPHGFNVGLPSGLDPTVTYEYTIVWGV